MKKIIFFLLLIEGIFSLPKQASATHLRAGDIVILRENCTSLTFTIKLNIFTDLGSEVRFGDGVLDFGDGVTATTPTVENILRPDLGNEVGLVVYEQKHTYGGPGRYIVSYREPNRNANILNMFGSTETQFYIETVINVDPFLGCNNTPQLLVPPIDGACTGSAWLHNPGAYDVDGDSLSFELVTPKQNKDLFVNDYLPPNDRKFYETIGLDYTISNERKNGPPGFVIDSKTGTITWDAPGASGEYNIAFLIKEWRKIGDTPVLLGYVTRDMQIIIEDCNNQRPELLVPNDLCVEAGTVITQDIFGTDPDGDNVKIEAYSVLFELPSSPATYTPASPSFQPTQPNDATQTFRWATQCEHVKEQPYQIVFKITDQPTQGVSLVSFETWNITVVAPAPILDEAENSTTLPRTAELRWQPYICSNAETIQIWRRKSIFDGTSPECVMGMPESWGYTNIAEVPVGETSFVDNDEGVGLIPGITYCYRIVATFPDPKGGESYVSQNQCLVTQADVPIPTQVSIETTDTTNGQITVSWRSPFEADILQFPPPYTFEVYRSEALSGILEEVKVHQGRLSDSTLMDSGLNTEEKIYNYRIIAFDSNDTEVGRSVTASSVRLTLGAQFEQIALSWKADVPWSNQAQQHPWHRIYRGPADATEAQMVLIDSVNVTNKSFNYIDRGQFNNISLSSEQKYCYRILTRGTYDNDKIEEPLENFSQIICAQPDDKIPPCKPSFSVSVDGISCDDYIAATSCDPATFSNSLVWSISSDPACEEEVVSYNIYMALEKGGDLILHRENYRGTSFIDENLPSFARCYKISAVDQAGNESELSDAFCFDNCPHYELPNVFTPNGDLCNQNFSAYNNRIVLDEQGNTPCGREDESQIRKRCARFVEYVNFNVFNRWGKRVYDYQSGGEKSIFIDWNGKDNFGRDLTEGLYYYSTEVIFDVVEVEKRNKVIKGWLQIIR